jgi:hypothetical protein
MTGKGLASIHSHLARFGLEVHIGRGGDLSKTKCVFFPPPQFFNDKLNHPSLTDDSTNDGDLWLISPTKCNELCPPERRESERARTAREDMRYDSLPETAEIKVADGYVTFSRKFKYLGSRIPYNLRDDDDINARLAAASQSMGALKEIWHNPHLDTYSKYLLFRGIPVNLLLWGCENWSLRQSLLRQLEVFLHRNIRWILNLLMSGVKEGRIRNKKVRQMFYDIPCIQNMIAARQLSFIGKVVQEPYDAPARRMLTACCQHKRKIRRPYLHNKDIIVRHLCLLFGLLCFHARRVRWIRKSIWKAELSRGS